MTGHTRTNHETNTRTQTRRHTRRRTPAQTNQPTNQPHTQPRPTNAFVCAFVSAFVCSFRGLFACVLSWVDIYEQNRARGQNLGNARFGELVARRCVIANVTRSKMLLAATTMASLPRLPCGASLDLTVPGFGRGFGTGGALWPAASVLCEYLSKQELSGLAVVELGSGTGAVGIYAAALGAGSVVLSDMSSSLRNCAADNVQANRVHFAQTPISCRTFSWGTRPITPLLMSDKGPDLVIGSDVTYSSRAYSSLCATLSDLFVTHSAPDSLDRPHDSQARAVLAHQHRPLTAMLSQVDALACLTEAADKNGLTVTVVQEVWRNPLSKIALIEVTRCTNN